MAEGLIRRATPEKTGCTPFRQKGHNQPMLPSLVCRDSPQTLARSDRACTVPGSFWAPLFRADQITL